MEKNIHIHQFFIFNQLVEYFDDVQTAEEDSLVPAPLSL